MLGTLLLTTSYAAENEAQVFQEDKKHVRTWNDFAKDLLNLHGKLTQATKTKVVLRQGGYEGFPDFFKEECFHEMPSGRLVSRIQWESRNLKNIHVIEVYIYNSQGKVIRDYTAAYLPQGRNAPVQTLINLHGYQGKMHGFRQFDASGDLLFEQCQGEFSGKPVLIRLFEDDLATGGEKVERVMTSGAYKACFAHVEKSAKRYLTPF